MKYAITTLGCKVNQYETQAMTSILGEHGHILTHDGDADAVIINTCAVTAESGRKSRQAVRRMKNENPGALVAVCGCFAQISPEEIEALGADIVFGSGDRVKLVQTVEEAVAGRKKVVNIDDPFKRESFEELSAGAVAGRTRAMLKVQDGCANFCTYCVIPYARGRVRSLPVSAAVKQAERIERDGFRELVITGIEIASYGKDFHDGTTFADVVVAVASAAPNLRIRLGSLEPTVITQELCSRIKACGNVCPHFHLSLQSGCDSTLRRMNRKYDTARFSGAVKLLRDYFPGCALTADLITGFPGETEDDHRATLEFIEECAFSSMHIFPYSQRPGTKAAVMDGQLTRAVKARRAHEAQELADKMEQRYLRSCVGQSFPVLFETEDGERSFGHADNYCEVTAEGTKLHGIVKNVKIMYVSQKILVGKLFD